MSNTRKVAHTNKTHWKQLKRDEYGSAALGIAPCFSRKSAAFKFFLVRLDLLEESKILRKIHHLGRLLVFASLVTQAYRGELTSPNNFADVVGIKCGKNINI